LNGSKFGPNLYKTYNFRRNLFWGAGCPGSNTFDVDSLCWREAACEIDSTTSTIGNAVEDITFKNVNLPLRPVHGLSLVKQPVKKGEVQAVKPKDMAGFAGTSTANFFGAYYFAPI